MPHSRTTRSRRFRWLTPALGLIAGLLSAPSFGQVGPEESARQFKPAAGLEATLWAAEPMLANATNLDVDSRGRVWVAEGLNYRLTRSGNKNLHRVDEADRIKILEDTDGDGKADKMTVFADKIFPVPMGLAVEERYGRDGNYLGCRVYVGNSPDLLVLEDTDGDDKADKRYPLLTGFGGIDSDHGVHGMVLGLDGKLYFTHGDGCCSVQQDKSEIRQNFDVHDKGGRHVSSDQLANTLRVNRDGTQFEVICDRQRNNYETSLNAFGNIFTSDNDDDGNRGCRVIQALDGGHYGYRTPGSPRHWGEDVPGTIPKIVGTGNGSPCGIMVYEGSLLPREYHGAVFMIDAGTRQVNFIPLARHGAAFRTEYKVLLGSDDPWFRPVDAAAAPDGSVFVADWYDSGVGGHGFRDQTTGRIYRVAPKGHKTQRIKVDFSTVDGLIAALKSPVVATQDTARRLLIERGKDQDQAAIAAVRKLGLKGEEPIHRARALWVAQAIEGDSVAITALSDGDPRIREQAVRMLGRDCRENGKVEYTKPEARLPAPALKHLDVLLKLADDPDAGVRRELILAFRNLPTDKVGDALKKLTASWDGQDRWYLESLGLALENREHDDISTLFNGTLFGEMTDLPKLGRNDHVALPPYFPADRNEAFLAIGDKELPATTLSKYLGLAWRLHRTEVLPLLAKVLPHLSGPDLQDAGDDVLRQLNFPEAAPLVADVAMKLTDPLRKRRFLTTLAAKLGGDWHSARGNPAVVRAIAQALSLPQTRAEGIAMAAATGNARYLDRFQKLATSTRDSEEVRIAAVDAIGNVDTPNRRKFLDGLVAASRGKSTPDSVAEAAVRSLPKAQGSGDALAAIVLAKDYPLGVRREALRTLASLKGGSQELLAIVTDKKLPDELKTEATTALHASNDRAVRAEAAKLLPLPKSADGRELPSLRELIRRDGDPARGEAVFFHKQTNACAGCHRVRGKGEWIGPDLSTIGVKYGREELLRSILNPSSAIGYNYRSQVVALTDGRVVTGLAVDDTPERLVIKDSAGKRLTIRPADVEGRKVSDVSLMPEGLAQGMTDTDLVDLLAYLTTLREPVSIVGQYHVVGPLTESGGKPALDLTTAIDVDSPISTRNGAKHSWRRLDANAEGIADLTPLIAGEAEASAYAAAPVFSPIPQKARLILESPAKIDAWLGGKTLGPIAPPSAGAEPRAVEIDLSPGTTWLLIRVAGSGSDTSAKVVSTFVSARPLSFTTGEAERPAH